MKKKLKLKKGDFVWVSLPTTARIKRVNKELGYTLETKPETKALWSYYRDEEVQKITEKDKKYFKDEFGKK